MVERRYYFFDCHMYPTHETILNTFVPSLNQVVTSTRLGERLLGGQWKNIDLPATALPWPRMIVSGSTSSATSARQSSLDNLLQRPTLSVPNIFRTRWPSLSQHMDQNKFILEGRHERRPNLVSQTKSHCHSANLPHALDFWSGTDALPFQWYCQLRSKRLPKPVSILDPRPDRAWRPWCQPFRLSVQLPSTTSRARHRQSYGSDLRNPFVEHVLCYASTTVGDVVHHSTAAERMPWTWQHTHMKNTHYKTDPKQNQTDTVRTIHRNKSSGHSPKHKTRMQTNGARHEVSKYITDSCWVTWAAHRGRSDPTYTAASPGTP